MPLENTSQAVSTVSVARFDPEENQFLAEVSFNMFVMFAVIVVEAFAVSEKHPDANNIITAIQIAAIFFIVMISLFLQLFAYDDLVCFLESVGLSYDNRTEFKKQA